MKLIPLTNGFFAIVDDDDFDEMSKYNWHTHENGKTRYAARYEPYRKYVYMHRQIMGFPDSKVDHKNRDGLDCRRGNLRTATSVHNNANQGKHRTVTSSKFKGVHWEQGRRKWRATICSQHIGRFESERAAARAYDSAAAEKWGEYAFLNFPVEVAQ